MKPTPEMFAHSYAKLQPLPITIRNACDFVHRHHRHNFPPQGALFAVGAEYCGDVVGVAIVGRPISRHKQDGVTAEVTRCCTKPTAPKNSCSFLYGCAWRAARALGWKRLITYTLKSESGASLRASGWRVLAETRGASPSAWQNRPGRKYQSVISEEKVVWELAL